VGEGVSVFEFEFEGGERERARGAASGGETVAESSREHFVLRFDHHRLDAFSVARDALRVGEGIARRLPRGYATLTDQLRRSLLSAYLGIAEASSRSGSDRLARFRCARGEASEAAAALEAVHLLGLAPTDQIDEALLLLDRLCAMLTRLAGLSRPAR
jgi:four helix bundle protein